MLGGECGGYEDRLDEAAPGKDIARSRSRVSVTVDMLFAEVGGGLAVGVRDSAHCMLSSIAWYALSSFAQDRPLGLTEKDEEGSISPTAV